MVSLDVRLGFSTMCIHDPRIDTLRKMDIYKTAGARSIEFALNTVSDLQNILELEGLEEKLKECDFDYMSIHVPFMKGYAAGPEGEIRRDELFYGMDKQTDDLLGNVKEACALAGADCAVMHPDTVLNGRVFEKMTSPEELGFTVGIENMDRRKKSFKKPKEVADLAKTYGLGIVLDQQHAYEEATDEKSKQNKPEYPNGLITYIEKLEEELIEDGNIGNRIKHSHVSGCRGSNRHSSVQGSENKELICGGISYLAREIQQNPNIPAFPIIFEGALEEGPPTPRPESEPNLEEKINQLIDTAEEELRIVAYYAAGKLAS